MDWPTVFLLNDIRPTDIVPLQQQKQKLSEILQQQKSEILQQQQSKVAQKLNFEYDD